MSKNPESITSAAAPPLDYHYLRIPWRHMNKAACCMDCRTDHFHSLKGREALGRSVAGLRSVAIISYGYIPLVLRATAREPGGTSPPLPRAISPGAAERERRECSNCNVGR